MEFYRDIGVGDTQYGVGFEDIKYGVSFREIKYLLINQIEGEIK